MKTADGLHSTHKHWNHTTILLTIWRSLPHNAT